MGECTSKEWGRGKKKMVKKKLTRAEVESLIPRRPGMTASEAAGATDVIMAAMEDVSTSWEAHDDDKFDHHEDQSRARKDEEVKRRDIVAISTRIEVPQHNLEEVIENAPPSSDANAQLDNEKHNHPMICTTASSSQRSESLIERFEYVQDSDSRLSDKETEIKSDTLLAEYLAAQQTFEKLSINAPQDSEHRNKEIIEMIHSTGLLGSVNKRIQDLLQLQLQSDTQVIKEQDMSESEREQMKESLTIGGSTQQMSKSYIVNLQKALQLIQLREATETEHEIGPKDPFAPEKVNTSECCGTSQSSSAQEIAHKDTNSNLKQKILADATLASLESLTLANRCELKEKLMNASILQQEQIKEFESMSNPGESDSHTDGKAENSHSIEEKDFSPIPTEDSINKETTPITDTGNRTTKVSHGELTWLSEQELVSDLPKTKNGNNTDSMKTKQTSLNIALDSVNTRSNASLQSHMEEEAKCMREKEATSNQALPFPQDAVTFEKDKIENGNPKNSKRGSLEIDESLKTLSQALPIIIPVMPNKDKLNASPSTVCTQSEEESVISNPQNDVMLEQNSTSKELQNMIKTFDYQEVQVTESIYKTGGGSKEDQEVDTNIEPGIYNEPKQSENTTNVVEQNEVSSNETQSSVHNEIAVALAITRIETDVGQKELAASSKLDSSIAVVDQEQKQKEILIGDVEEEKREETIQQQLHPADHIEAVMMTQTLSLNQDSDNSIVAVNNTSKHLPADDDQYQQLAEKTIQESMSDMKNELLVPEGSFTQAAQETYLSAPILEDAREVSAFDMSARTDENTSKTIEMRNNNVFQGMSNTTPELFQQSHTDITVVVETNNGNKKCTAEKELELQEVKIDSRKVNENDEAETFRSEEKKLDEDSLPQAPIISSIDGCETSKSSLVIEFPSTKESVAILQCQTEDEAHPKELAKELTLHTRSKEDAEFLIDTTSLTEEVRKVTTRERDLSVLTDQEVPIRSPTEMEVQVIQSTGISSTSSIDETAMGDRTENPISSLEFQTAEHALISQEGKDKNINQIKYINKDDGGFKRALDFEIKAAQNVDTPENANRLSSDEDQSFHVPEVNKNMPTQEEDTARIQNSTSISLDQVIVSDDLTSEEMDKIHQDSVTESFESPDIKLNSQTGMDSVEVLQTMKVATENDLQEINESTIQPMQHGESTVNESSPVLCDMPTITDGATTDECIDGDGTNESSPRLELPILTDKEDGYVVKRIGQTEECQVQQVKIYDDIVRMDNTGTALSRQAEAIKHTQMSPKENSAASSHVAVFPVPEAKESEAVSTFNQGAMTRDSYPTIDTRDDDLLGIPITVPFLSRQTEAMQYEQMLCTKDSLVVTHVTEIVKEAANMNTESPRDLKPSFDKQETLSSLQTDEYNIPMPIPEVEASKAISAFDTGKMPDKDSSLVIERGYNYLLGENETVPILVLPVEPAQHEKTLSIEDAGIMNNFSAGIGQAIQIDTMEKARDLQLSINREEVASSHETDKSNLMVQNQDTEATGAVSYFYASGITDKNNSPVIESGNYMLQGMTNTTTVLDQQAELASQQKILFEEEAIVVTHVSPRTEKETSSDILDSARSLQLPSKEEDASSSHETDEFELVSLPEDTTPGAAQTFDIGEVTDKDSSPVIKTGNNKLIVMTNAVDDLVAQTEAVQKEKISSTDDSKVVTHVASGIEKETASKTLESMEASKISFEEKETSNSYYIDTSHLPVPIPQSAEFKVPAFDTVVMAGERIFPSTETTNDDSQRLTADLLVPTNNPTCLDHQIEATLDQKISSIEVPVGERNASLGTEMESVSKNIESTRNLQLSFNPEESLCEGDRSNPDITITEVEAPEATSEFDPVAMTDKNTFPVIELENYDSLGMTHTKTGLVQQDGDDLLKQMSHGEDSKVVTQVSAEIAKGTSSETLQSTGDLQLPLEEKEISKLHRNEKSSLMVKIPRVEEEDASRSHATDTSDLTVPILHVDEEDASHASETDESKRIIPIPGEVSTSDIGADAHEDGSLARETGNKKLGGDTNPVPGLVPQEEVTLNGQMSSTDNSVVVSRAATEVQTETANETTESTGDLQHSFEKEDSISYDIDKPNLAVPILEVEATESVSAIVTDAITENENTPDKQTRSDDSVGLTDNLPVLTNIKPALVQQTDNIQNEQILSVQDKAVDKANAATTENETMSEPTESTGNFEFKFKDEESLHEINKSNITFPIPEVKESEAVPASEAVTVTDEIIIPDIQSENNDFLGMAHSETALAQQDGSSLLKQMSNVQNSMVVTQVSAGYGKETSCETLESTRDLQISAEEKEASSLHESDKSSQLFPNPQAEELDASSSYKTDKYELLAPIPEDTSEIISTFDIGSGADKDRSPTMKIEIDKLKEATNNVPALVAQADVTLDKEASVTGNLIVVNQVTTGIDEGAANGTHQSGGDEQLPFREEEASNSYDIYIFNLAAPIQKLEPTEAISAFNTVDMICEESSPATETSSDDSPATNDSLVPTNIKPDLVQKTEATLDEQMSSIKVPVAETQDTTANVKETASEIPKPTEDLQPSIGENESMSEIDESNITVPLSEVEESVAATAFQTDAVTDNFTVSGIQSENIDLLRMNNIETALVQQNGATLIEQKSSVEDSKVLTQVSTGIGKETASETLESTNDLQLAGQENETSSQIDKFTITIPFSDFEDLEADKASEIDTVTHKFITPIVQSENDNLLPMINNKTALVQQDGATLFQHISCTENSIVLPQVSAEIGKETSSDIRVSTKDLQLSVDDKETSNSHESNKSSQMFHIPDAQEKLSLSSQEIEKFELISLIPEDTASEADSTFGIRAKVNQEDSPTMKTGNNNLVGVTNTVSALVAQAEVTLNDQISATDDSIVVTQVAAGIEKESSSKNSQSMGDLQIKFDEKEASNSYDDKSSLKVSIIEVEQTEAVSIFHRVVTINEESSPVIETRNDDSLGVTANLMATQAEPIQHEQISTIQLSGVESETHEATGTKKGTATETPESTRDFKFPIEQEESLCEIDKSNISVPISKIEAFEAVPAIEMIAMTDNIIIPVGKSENNNLIEMSNTETTLVHQDQATILEEMSCLKDSMVLTQVPARIGEETSSGTFESTNDLQLSVEEKEASSFHESDKSSQTFGTSKAEEENSWSSQETEKSKLKVSIPEDITSKVVSANDTFVEAYQGSSPAMETGDNKLMGVMNTETVQVAEEEITLNAQMSNKDDSIVGAQATGFNEESASGTLQSMQELYLSFDDETGSKSFDINNSYLVVPITEVEETEVVPTFHTVATTHEDSSPLIASRNDDSLRFTDDVLVPTSTELNLVQQSGPIQHEQMSSIKEVETYDATENSQETVSGIPESSRELALSSEQKESLCKIGESNISAPIPKVDALEEAPALEMTAMTDNIIIPFGKSKNDDLLERSNPENSLVHQDPAILLDKISCVEDSVVVTNESAGIGKETTSKISASTRVLQPSFEKREASIFCESNKSSQMVQIPKVEEEDTLNSQENDKSELVIQFPEDTTIQSVSTIDIDAEVDQDESTSMDTENNNLEGVINTEPVLVAQTETTTLNEQTLSIDHTVLATQVAAGIEEETVSETPQLMGYIKPLFAEKKYSHSYDNYKSNAAVPILEVEAAEEVSAIDMCAMTHEKSSPIIEIKNDETLELVDDLLLLNNTQPALIQQAEAAPHGQIPLTENLVVETHDATVTKKETMRETPRSARDLKPPFKQEESLCETDKFNITVPNPEVEALEADSAFKMISGTEKNSSPVEESENKKLLEMSNTKIAPIHQDKAALLDLISCAEELMVVTSVSAGTEKDTSSEVPNSTKDLQLSVVEKKASSLYESDKSSQIVQIPEVEENDTILAVSTINTAKETERNDSLAIENENNKLVGVIKTVPILVAQTETAVNEKTPYTDESVIETQVAAGIEEEIVYKPLPSMENLQLSFEEGETSESYHIVKSNLEVPTPEVEAKETVSAFHTDAMTHEKGFPIIEIRNDGALELTDDLLVLTNTVTGLIQQAESTLHEQMPSLEESLVETHNAIGTAEETVRTTPGSIKDLQFSFGHEESLCEINRSNTTAPPPVVEVLEATPAMEMIAVTDNMIIPDDELENNKLIEISNPETTLIHQDMATHLDQISSVEDSIVVTEISAEIGKDTSSKVGASTRDLEISVEEKEAASSLNTSAQMVPIPENDKSRLIVQNTTAPPPVVEVLEAAPAIEMIVVTDNVIIPDGELENKKIIEISNPETTLIHQDMATHLDQISFVEHSIVLTDISAEIGKDTLSKIAASTRDLDISVEEKEAASSLKASAQMVPIPENDKSGLIVQIPEDTTLGVMSTIHIAAGSDQNDSPVVENDKDILVGMIGTMPVSVLQTEATLNEQTSSIDDSMTKTQVSADIEEETERETQSKGNVQLSVKDEKTSHSYDIGKSNLEVPIPEVKPTEAVLSFDTDAMTHRECSPLIKIMNDNTLELKDDLLDLTNTRVALVQHTEGTPHEQMPAIEVSLVETHDARGTEKETVSEAPGSTRDLQLLLKQEEKSCEIDESNITFPIPEVKALEPASAFEMISTDKTIIHVGQSENNDLLGKSNTKTTLLEKISSVEDSMVVTHVSEGIGKKASSETSYSTRDLDLSVGEKRISSLHESDESSQTVPIPEDTKIEAESTFAMFAKADHNIASDMGTKNNKSVEVTKAVPALVAEADANLNEQISSINDPIAVTEVASQIEEGTASEILQSVEDLQLLFEKKEASSSYDIDKSNLAVLIPEAVSAFHTEAETNNERSSVKETTNNDPLELIDDCLPMTNTEPTLVKQNEDTVHKQMSPIEESVFERHDAAETEKETVTVDPESTGDLQLSFEQEEGMCETDKSNIAISKAGIEPSETTPFEMAALSDKINIPIKKSNSKNGDLLEMTDMETALAQQDGATLFKKTYCVEDSMVATYDPAEIGKGSSNEIPESTRYLQIPMDEEEKSSLHKSGRFSQMVQFKEVEEEDATSSSKLIVLIPKDAKLGAVSNFDISAEADRDSCPAMETQNNKLVGVANTVPPLVTQAKITLNEQSSNLDDSIVVTKFASGIEEETARETLQSMGDLHLPFEENEASNSCNTDKSNLLALIPEAEAAGVPSFDTDAKIHKESSPGIETRNDDPLELINDHQVLDKTEPALVQQAEATLQEQMSYTEEPIVETHIDVMTEKKTVSKNTESTGNLQPSLRQEEVMCKIDKPSIVVSVPEVAPSEAVPFEMAVVTEKISVPVKESKNNDLSEMTDTETGLVQRDEATLSEQMSCMEDSMVVTYITAEVGKETSSEIPESTRDIQTAIKDVEAPSLHESGKSSLQAQITDVEEEDTSSTHMIDESELMFETTKSISEPTSTFNIDAGADLGGSPYMETENKKLAGMTSTLPALVAHAETTLNEQLSFIDDSANAVQIDTAIKKEIASETPQSIGDLKLSFEEKEASTSYNIDKSDLAGSIPEVEAREAFCTFDTEDTSYQKSSPVIKTRNDDPLELTGNLQIATNTKPALAQNIDAILHEQTKSIENPVVESHIAAATEKETVTENNESTRDLHISLDREERLCEVDKSNITVPAPEFEASEAAPFESISVPDKIIIPVIESKNNDLLEMNNTKTALVQQDGATLFEQNVCVDSMVVKYISSETEIETSNEIPESTKDSEASNLHESGKSSLQVQIPDVEENDALSSHETDKYESMVLIPEDTTLEAVAAFDIDVGADQSNSPVMESENNKLVGAANTVPSLATQAEIALYEQTSSVTDSIVVPQFATAIDEETATESPQSIGDIEVSLKDEEATETVSTFDTVLMSHVKSSPVIEPRNEDSVELPNDLLVLTNTKPALVQKAEVALHEQMLTIEDSVVDKHTAAATENDTPESTEDLQLPMKDVLCKIDKSRATVAVPEVEATEAVPEFNALAVPEIKIIPVTESEKNGIPRMANTEIAPVQLDGASLLEQMSHGEDPMVVTHDSAGI